MILVYIFCTFLRWRDSILPAAGTFGVKFVSYLYVISFSFLLVIKMCLISVKTCMYNIT